jgi:hypothetical protein
LLDIVHNIPKFLEGTHSLGFDERWFAGALRAFDEHNATDMAARYAERLGASST